MTQDWTARARADAKRRWLGGFLAALLGFTALGLFVASPVAAVAVAVPYSTTPVADADLDGDPATGAWTDATSAVVPLENGEAGAYGSATLYAKHDGTTAFFRIDGSIDVPWTSATGNRFWLGMELSTGTSGHHAGTPWDGWYFGLWDGGDYTPQPTYPPAIVDTFDFGQPPPKDIVQSTTGTMRYAGAAAPYTFTAEWKRALSTGDAEDIAFTADGAATYYFYITTDSDGGGSNGGAIRHRRITNVNTIVFNPAVVNTAPTVDLTDPDGGEVWTGGTPHAIRWNMSDAESPTPSLRVWLDYSTDGGGSFLPIAAAQDITGFTNPCTFSWTVPAVDTVQARVRVTVRDAGSLTAADASLANFAIDATPPTVAFTPADGASGVSPSVVVRADFSEPMNTPSAEAAFSLMRVDTSTYVSGTFGWAANQLSFTPSAALAQGVAYRAQVNASARDTSDPGNPLASVRTATFATADVTPPAIASVTAIPDPQEAGFPLNVSAAVTDNGALAGVWIEVRDPLGGSLGNLSATQDGGSGRYFRTQPYAMPGLHAFTISAADVAGLWAVATGSFQIVDMMPPAITHTPVAQALQNVPIRIAATVTDGNAVADARIDYTDVLGMPTNASMVLNGTVYEYAIPGQPVLGTLTYFLWAVDPSANSARTPTYSVSIVGADVEPPLIAGVAATPPVQDATLPVNLTATVTDNVAVARVDAVVTDPLGAVLGNFSMARVVPTDEYAFERPYDALGNYSVVVWAVDTTGNNASASGAFEVVDRIAPVLSAVAAAPSPQEAGLPVNISADATDNVAVADVRARVYDPSAALVLDAPMLRAGSLFWVAQPFATLGAYTFTLTARDTSGNPATDGGSFAIVDTMPPVADAGPDRLVTPGTLVTFDGSGSSDNAGVISNYTWSLSDPAPVTMYGVSPAHAFATAGSFPVTLTVRDASGNPDSDTAAVVVSADAGPPVAEAGPPQVVLRGTLVTLDGTASTDDVGIVNYTWTFGDPGPVTLWGATVTHRFSRTANVTVTLQVRDALGSSDADATWVDVRPDPSPPVADAGPDQTIDLGSEVFLDGSGSTDNVAIVSYEWFVERTSAVLAGAQVSFTPSAGGVWRVVLTVRDPAGLVGTDDAIVTALVRDAEPPSPPIDLAAATDGVGAIRLTWIASPEPDVVGYLVYRSESADGPFVRINVNPVLNTSYADDGLGPGDPYWYEVRAVDAAGNPSDPSNRADAVAGAAPPEAFNWWSALCVLLPLLLVAIMGVIAVLGRRRREGAAPVGAAPEAGTSKPAAAEPSPPEPEAPPKPPGPPPP